MICTPTAQAIKATSLSQSTLYRLRARGEFQVGIHYAEVGARKLLWNLPLLLDWIANRHHPAMHELAIRNYLASLPSSQQPNKKAGRKPARRYSV